MLVPGPTPCRLDPREDVPASAPFKGGLVPLVSFELPQSGAPPRSSAATSLDPHCCSPSPALHQRFLVNPKLMPVDHLVLPCIISPGLAPRSPSISPPLVVHPAPQPVTAAELNGPYWCFKSDEPTLGLRDAASMRQSHSRSFRNWPQPLPFQQLQVL